MANVSRLETPLQPRRRRDQLTNDLIDRLRLKPGERVYDNQVRGFYIQGGLRGAAFRVMADPPKKTRIALGWPKTLERTIGRWPEVSAAKARGEAQRIIGLIKSGTDPKEPEKAHECPTLQTAFDAFVASLTKRLTANDPRRQ